MTDDPRALDRRAMLAGGILICAGAAGIAPGLLIVSEAPHVIDLAGMVPARIGQWTLDARATPVLPDPAEAATVARTYDQTLARVYRSGERVVMLVIARGSRRSGTLAVHRPATCYAAQGFQVTDERDATLPLPFASIATRRLFAAKDDRAEPIVYWVTLDGTVTGAGVAQKIAGLRAEFAGRRADGFLVRASTLAPDSPQAYAAVDRFLVTMLAAVPAPLRHMLAGVA